MESGCSSQGVEVRAVNSRWLRQGGEIRMAESGW